MRGVHAAGEAGDRALQGRRAVQSWLGAWALRIQRVPNVPCPAAGLLPPQVEVLLDLRELRYVRLELGMHLLLRHRCNILLGLPHLRGHRHPWLLIGHELHGTPGVQLLCNWRQARARLGRRRDCRINASRCSGAVSLCRLRVLSAQSLHVDIQSTHVETESVAEVKCVRVACGAACSDEFCGVVAHAPAPVGHTDRTANADFPNRRGSSLRLLRQLGLRTLRHTERMLVLGLCLRCDLGVRLVRLLSLQLSLLSRGLLGISDGLPVLVLDVDLVLQVHLMLHCDIWIFRCEVAACCARPNTAKTATTRRRPWVAELAFDTASWCYA